MKAFKTKLSNRTKLPFFLIKYFWEVDFKSLNAKEYSTFILERILEYGDERAVKWALNNFSDFQLKRVLSSRKNFSKKSANYWSLILGIPKNKILCLNKSYREMQKSHWPY